MAEEVKVAKRTAKDDFHKTSKSSVIVYNRLQRLNGLNLLVGKLKEELADESHLGETLQISSTICLQIKLERNIRRPRGSLQWPVHIVMLICELLVNATPPSAILSDIQKMPADLVGCEVNELPSLDYVSNCCVVVQYLKNMLAACRLGKSDNWHHIFTDGTTWRQITFQNLMIGLMTDGDFESVIVSLCIFLEN